MLAALVSLSLAAVAPQDHFSETRRLVPSVDFPEFMDDAAGAAGDIDGDGQPDVLTVSPTNDNLLYGHADGRFEDGSADLPTLQGSNTAVALGDLNGDGQLDALVGNSFSQSAVYAGSGGRLAFLAAFGELHTASGVALGDLDLDGDLDVVISSKSSTFESAVYVNDGAAGLTLQAYALPSPAWTEARDVALADFDGDGQLDVYLSSADSFSLGGADRLFLNLGSALFAEAASSPMKFPSYGVSTADADGDGDIDVYLSRSGGISDQVGLNQGAGSFAFSEPPLPFGSDSSVFADLTGDQIPDVLAFGFPNKLWIGLGTGAFSDGSALIPEPSFPRVRVVEDFDGDQDLDVFLAGNPTGLWLNGPLGLREFDVHHPFIPPLFNLGLAVGDVTGDGDDDVLSTGFPSRVLLGDGTGSLVDGGTAAPHVSIPFVVDLSDVDGRRRSRCALRWLDLRHPDSAQRRSRCVHQRTRLCPRIRVFDAVDDGRRGR